MTHSHSRDRVRLEGGSAMSSMHRSLPLAAALLMLGFALTGTAQVPDSYSGMSPLIGDTHQHTMPPQDAKALSDGVPGTPDYCTWGVGTRDEFGFPPVVLDAQRAAGYDWVNLSPHTTPGMTENSTDPAYVWWTSQTFDHPIFPADPSAIKDIVYKVPPANTLLNQFIFRRTTQ